MHRGFSDTLWDFLGSLKLTIPLLISLALASIIGTLPQEYLAQLTPFEHRICTILGLFDIYHSWWFLTLLNLISLNLLCCSLKRLPHVLKFITKPLLVIDQESRKRFTMKRECGFIVPQDLVEKRVAAFLHAEMATPVVTDLGTEQQQFAQKNAWSRLGVYLVHLSILVILSGGIVGLLFGYSGFVKIIEGDAVSSVTLHNGRKIALGFELRCDRFTATFYDNGLPKEYKSILTVMENGQPVKGYTNSRIVVNQPLTYNGITFYQSSYGNAGNLYFYLTGRNGKNKTLLTVAPGSSAKLPDGTLLRVRQVIKDISVFEEGRSGAAAEIELSRVDGERVGKFIVYAAHPELDLELAQERGWVFLLHYKGAEEKMYTGLKVSKDPGVWLVWIGCALMIAGLYIALFMRHKRLWVVIKKDHLCIYGDVNKHQAAFGPEFDQLAQRLEKFVNGESSRDD